MKRLKEFSHGGLSTLPKKINQKLVNENRIKHFQKLRDSFKNVTREIELEECIKNRALIDIIKPINNCWFMPNIGA